MAAVEEPVPPEVELDLARYQVRRGGRVHRLEKLPMELLTLLAERRGELVTRAEIVERLWGRDVFVDADAAINTAVRKVRRALADDSEAPRFLETVVGKGYRFVGPITVIPGAEPMSSAPEGPGGSEGLPVRMGAAVVSKRSASGRWALGAIALAMVIVAVLAGLGRLGARAGQAMESVAVLPF